MFTNDTAQEKTRDRGDSRSPALKGWGWQEGSGGRDRCARPTEEEWWDLGCQAAKVMGAAGEGGSEEDAYQAPRARRGMGHEQGIATRSCQQVRVARRRDQCGNSGLASPTTTWAGGGRLGKHLGPDLPCYLLGPSPTSSSSSGRWLFPEAWSPPSPWASTFTRG